MDRVQTQAPHGTNLPLEYLIQQEDDSRDQIKFAAASLLDHYDILSTWLYTIRTDDFIQLSSTSMQASK